MWEHTYYTKFKLCQIVNYTRKKFCRMFSGWRREWKNLFVIGCDYNVLKTPFTSLNRTDCSTFLKANLKERSHLRRLRLKNAEDAFWSKKLSLMPERDLSEHAPTCLELYSITSFYFVTCEWALWARVFFIDKPFCPSVM